jgi:hypothetical protein
MGKAGTRVKVVMGVSTREANPLRPMTPWNYGLCSARFDTMGWAFRR